MTSENILMAVSKVSAMDLSTYKNKAVVLDSDGKITAVTASTDKPFGILYGEPVTDEAGSVIPIGPGGSAKVVAGATIDEGASVSITADGSAGASTSGNYDIGICENGGASGELIKVLLNNLVVKA